VTSRRTALKQLSLFSVLASAIWLVAGCNLAPKVEPATLVLTNGKIVTVDPLRPEAEALAVVGDRIVALGSEREIRPYIGPRTEIFDLGGRLAVPGFIEGHGHFVGLGQSRMILDLTQARSWDELVAMVAEAAEAASPGEWIFGRGWHQERWTGTPAEAVDGVPPHRTLSAVSPANPVYLTHASGHASIANAKALELAGITRRTADPAGGTIVRDGRGEATGLLRENAQGLVQRAVAREEERRPAEEATARLRRAVELAAEESLRKGVTSFQDAGTSFATVDFFKRLADEGALPVRLYVMVNGSNEEMAEKLPQYRMIGAGDNHLTVRAIKRQIDGAMGPHGAWLLEPYSDLPETSGLALQSPEMIERTAALALQHGYQLNTHAIGDRANREVLDIYERSFRGHLAAEDPRWRIEHAQHVDPADLMRFKELGVIASMQAVHATSDGSWVGKRLGEARTEATSYLWRTLLDNGIVVTNGTDTPVEDLDPIAGFHASVARRVADGSVFMPEQRMTREEALRSYTLSNAYAAFEEELKGSLTPGKLADIVVLSKDIMTIPEEEIPETRVVFTIVGGKVLYRDPAVDR
jgi:predicted amidohydrolase YtcJ